jgi:CelD/BcsL family acetyltransferase involved in cellulose biosynthesis
LRILKWLGQDHANYNMGLFAPEAAKALDRHDMSRLLREAGRHAGAAAAIFAAQPVKWNDQPNPLALLPHQDAPNSGYAVALTGFDELYRTRFSKRSRYTLERKERRLEAMGRLEYGWAETHDEKRAVLETFFTQKAKQFAAMGVTDVFDADTRAFYRALALLDGESPSRLRLGYVKLDGAILATFSGFLFQDRLGVELSSLAEGEAQRQSPGALLLRHQIHEAADAGLAYYDLGVGQARHKDDWCNTVYALFDSFIAFKPQGLLLSLPLAGVARLKRSIKSNDRLWRFAQTVRKRLFSRDF